jgi:hypothetical protein
MKREQLKLCQEIAALIVAGTAAAWPGCAGARMGSSAPAVPDYGQQTAATLQAQVNEAPELFQANATFQPQYSGLNLSNISTLLNGATNAWGQTTTPGLLSEYQNQAAPAAAAAQAAANTTQAQSTLTNLAQLGPQYTAAINAASPESANLLGQLNTQASSELAAGTQLTADQQRQLNNQVNAAQASRGVAYGPAAAYGNVLANSQAGQQMQQQRQQFAGSVLGANNQFYTDPFLSILGTPSNSTGAAGNLLGGASQLLPGQQFNPNAGESVYNSQAQTASANTASSNSLTGSLIGAGASLTGSLIGAGASSTGSLIGAGASSLGSLAMLALL